MANEARHHHHIPQFYLRGFAASTGKDDHKLTVANLMQLYRDDQFIH